MVILPWPTATVYIPGELWRFHPLSSLRKSSENKGGSLGMG